MIKRNILVVIICLSATFTSVKSQNWEKDLVLLDSMAVKLMNSVTYRIIDNATGQVFESSEGLEPKKSMGIESIFNHWKYSNGVINLGMLELARLTENGEYKDHVLKYYDFFFGEKDFFSEIFEQGNRSWDFQGFFRMGWLDDCGALGSALIETYEFDPREEYKIYLEKAANFMENEVVRLEDGTFARLQPYQKTVWLDDLFMSVPFLVRMADFTGEEKYFDLAVKQVMQFHEYLWDEKSEIYYHAYYDDLKCNGVACWGRANGWAFMAQANLLEYLPENHPSRDELIRLLNKQIRGISRYQSQNGLWHQLLDKPDSYLETSCTSMFTFTIAKAINKGWLDERYASVALKGWEGIQSKIDENYNILGVCQGTGIRNDLAYYYDRPTPLNDFHGIGATILAGCEIVKLKMSMEQ